MQSITRTVDCKVEINMSLTLRVLLPLLLLVAQSTSDKPIIVSPGTAFFTYIHEYKDIGIRVVYQPNFTVAGVDLKDRGSLRYCIAFDPGYPDNEKSKLEFEDIMDSVYWPNRLSWSEEGDYLYEEVASTHLIPNSWVLFEVGIYLSTNRYSCRWRLDSADYIDTYRFYHVPPEVRYCELDTLESESNITKCSQVLDGTSQGLIHGVNRPTTVESPKCSTTACQWTPIVLGIAIPVICVVVVIIAVGLIIAAQRSEPRDREVSIRYNARTQCTEDHPQTNTTSGRTDPLLPQYKDLPRIDAPPPYEQCNLTEQV